MCGMVSYFNVGGKPSTACSDTWQLRYVRHTTYQARSQDFENVDVCMHAGLGGLRGWSPSKFKKRSSEIVSEAILGH